MQSNLSSSRLPRALERLRLRSVFSTYLEQEGLAALVTTRHLDPLSPCPELLSIEFEAVRQVRPKELLEAMQRARSLSGIDVGGLRRKLNSSLGSFLTRHLLESQTVFVEDLDPFKRLAQRYIQLLSWGETKAAKVLAEIDSVPVRTVHTHLYQARQQGYLVSPGKGIRTPL